VFHSFNVSFFLCFFLFVFHSFYVFLFMSFFLCLSFYGGAKYISLPHFNYVPLRYLVTPCM
jgi:hypothetical protein